MWCGSYLKASLSTKQVWTQLQNIQRVSIYSASPFGPERDKHAPPSPPSAWAEWHIYSESNDTRYQKWEGSSVASGLRNLSNELDNKALLVQGRSI